MKFYLRHKIKTILGNYCLNMSIEGIFRNTEKSKASEPHNVNKVSDREVFKRN